MTAQPRRLGVLFGGPSPEHDVSVLTGLQAARALVEAGGFDELNVLYWSKNGTFHKVDPTSEASSFSHGAPEDSLAVELALGNDRGFSTRKGRLGGAKIVPVAVDAILNCCHGGPGEDGSLQGALDLAGIAYTGPSGPSAALGMDKLAQAGVIAAAGIPALPRVLLSAKTSQVPGDGPFIVKPRYGGSSIGIEVVEDLATARARLVANVHLRDGAVIEPYRQELFDLEIAIRTYPTPELSAIARPLRAVPSSSILSYAEKYVGGEGMVTAARELPAVLPPALCEDLRRIATHAGEVLGARGVSRLDFLSDGDAVYFNEINTIPGSLSRYLFIDPPITFVELLNALLLEASERPTARLSSVGADGTLLRDAASIAAKLA